MTAGVLHLDLESRSKADLTKVGAHRYAEDPSTEIVLGAGAYDPTAVGSFRKGDALATIRHHIVRGGQIRAHNATFEHAMLAANGLDVPWSQMDCTMARAMACGLPGALFLVAKAMKTDEGKDLEGYKLMMKMCRPQPDGSWYEPEHALQALQRYCEQDVRTECAIDRALPPLSARERRVWELDQTINDRGVFLDRPMIEVAAQVVTYVMAQANAEMSRLTNGVVKKVTEAKKIVAWIKSQGVPCDSIGKGAQEEIFAGAEVLDLPHVARVLELRVATSKAFKYEAMLDSMCRDDCVRGSLGYHGTIQGRWIGRGVQFHNMKRIETEEDDADVAIMVGMLHSGAPARVIADNMAVLFPSPLETLSICTRATVVAQPHTKLVGGDFSNIEGRINAWIAGQEDKLDAFRAFDAGEGPDLYKVTAAQIIGVPVDEVTREQRQEQGKVPELACGYQGSVNAFRKMGAKYGVRLPDSRVRTIVEGWRVTNDKIVDSWKIYQDAAIEAVSNRGCVISVLNDRVQYAADKSFLYCKLPSGRFIHYPSPKVAWKTKTIKDADGDDIEINRQTVSYWGQHAGQWREQDLYGGAQCAHVVSGIARDVLVEAMFRAEAAGYELRLTVHDELLCQVPQGFGSAEELERLILEPIDWMGDCPITAKTWEGDRYG